MVLKRSSPDRVLAMGSVGATLEDRYRFFQAIPLRCFTLAFLHVCETEKVVLLAWSTKGCCRNEVLRFPRLCLVPHQVWTMCKGQSIARRFLCQFMTSGQRPEDKWTVNFMLCALAQSKSRERNTSFLAIFWTVWSLFKRKKWQLMAFVRCDLATHCDLYSCTS